MVNNMNADRLNFKWKGNKGQFQTGESLYLGKIRVGAYNWNSSRSRSNPRDATLTYSGSSILPQLDRTVYGQTPEEIKGKIERQVIVWFKEALA